MKLREVVNNNTSPMEWTNKTALSPARTKVNAIPDRKKNSFADFLLANEEFKSLKSFRMQCHYLAEKSKQLTIEKHDGACKLTHYDIGMLFNVQPKDISYHISMAKREIEGKVKSNGRPYILDESEIESIKKWVKNQDAPPKVSALHNHIISTFKKDLSYNQLVLLMDKMEYEAKEAIPIEDERYFCDPKKIAFFYDELYAFTFANNIPSAFIYNLDEEGNEEFVDAKRDKVVAPKGGMGSCFYPVSRKQDHATVLACIVANGTFLKPLFVVQRATIEASLLLHNMGPDKISIEQAESGYINSAIFDKWLKEVFIVHVEKSRKEFDYAGPGILLLDGCSVHITEYLYDLCEEINIRVFFLPSHSSNQTQPLDLGIFHIHKCFIRKNPFHDIDETMLVKRIIDIYSAWTRAAIVENITQAFAAAGAIYYIGGKSYTCVVFDILRTSKILVQQDGTPMLTASKYLKNHDIVKSILLEKGKKRIKLQDFNKMHEIDATNDKIATQALLHQIINNNALTMHDRLLTSMAPVFIVGRSPMNQVPKKGKKKREPIEVDQEYARLPFDERITAEVNAVFGF